MDNSDGRRDREEDRTRSRRDPRNAMEAVPRDTYYREEYGWIMSDSDVAAEQEIEGQYQQNYENLQVEYGGLLEDMKSQVSSGASEISNHYASAANDTTTVRIVNGDNVEASYVVPSSYASELNSADGLFTAYHDGYLNVDVHASGGTTIGQELHDAAREAEQLQSEYDKSLQAQEAAELSNYHSAANTAIEGQTEVLNASLQEAETAYGDRVAEGAEAYNEFKQDYNDSVQGVDGGLLETDYSFKPMGSE